MSRITQLRKAELHVHLEGSMEPATLREIEPSLDPDLIRERYTYTDFPGFLRSYVWANRFLVGPDEYALAARRLFQRLAGENVVYCELNLSVGVMLWRGQDFHAILDAVQKEASASQVEVRYILDAVRQWGPVPAWEVAHLAVERSDDGVVGFGIGGDEANGPAGWFAHVFDYVRSHGLHLAPHAGETCGAESVWDSIRLGAERIGHGINSVEDPALMRHLRDRGIPLEICISSNVCTGATRSLAAHPVRRLYDAGVPITLNTDDPAMFRTTLSGEYEIAAREFGFSESELDEIASNAFRFRFL